MEPDFIKSANVCLDNAQRLLDDAQRLEFEKPPATKCYLSVIAQEECAKGFLLYLVSNKVIPWNKMIHRAARDHKCKQLVGVILDFLNPDIDEFIKRFRATEYIDFPKRVADAINIFCHEKIHRWESDTWFWDEEPQYDAIPLSISDGKQDREKQQSLYVEIAKDGNADYTPGKISEEQADYEYEKGGRFSHLLKDLLSGENYQSRDYENIISSFKVLFESIYNKKRPL